MANADMIPQALLMAGFNRHAVSKMERRRVDEQPPPDAALTT